MEAFVYAIVRYADVRALSTPSFMALTSKDLTQIQELLTAQDRRLRLDLREALTQQAQDIKCDIRDEMEARFAASHATMRGEMLNVITHNIMPAFDALHHELRDVKREIVAIRAFIHMPSPSSSS